MNLFERVAFTFVLNWGLLDAFVTGISHAEKIKSCLIVTASMVYLYGLHNIIFSQVKRWLRIGM